MSDATQKQMERDRSSAATTDDQLRCRCPAGKACHLIGFIDTAYKPHYRGQMIKLMQTVIEHTCDPNHDCTEDTKRVKNLKNEMGFVRSLKNTPWPDLTSMFIYSKEPVCITMREILDVMTERRDQMGIYEVLCLCTCVTDLCSSLVAKIFWTRDIWNYWIAGQFHFTQKRIGRQRFSLLARPLCVTVIWTFSSLIQCMFIDILLK